MFIKKMCNTNYCDDCGENAGYNMIRGDFLYPTNYNITPNRPNISHDLRLAYAFKGLFVNTFKCCEGIVYDSEYGTKEIRKSTFTNDKKVRNIFDMRQALENYWNSPNYEREKKTNEWVKVAEMHIYEDGRDCEFTLF
jgi:hypothetical protein